MKPNSDSVTGKGPQSSNRRPSGGSVPNEGFGFQLSENQFQVLHSDQPAVSRTTEQREEGLVDPRSTRRLRWAARGTEAQGTKLEEAAFPTVYYSDAQGTCTNSGNVINPVAIDYSSQFLNSFSARPSDNFTEQSVGTVHY